MNAPNIQRPVIVIRPHRYVSETTAEQDPVPQHLACKDIAKLICEFEQSGKLCGVQLLNSGFIFSH